MRAKTVAGLLKKHKITLQKQDIVSPPSYSNVPYNGMVRIIRVTEKTEQQIIPVGERTKRQKSDKNLRQVVIEDGYYLEKFVSLKKTFYDNKERSIKIIKEKETKKRVYRLTLLNKNGLPEVSYNLLKTPKLRMVATAYYPGDPLAWKDGTITFLDLKMQRGIVAVDPKIIPLRTRVYVPGYGYGYAGDTGSAIKDNRIDLGVNNSEEEKPWMHKKVTVYLLGKSKTW
jgi:3D (Asp-Asp-Asp) domain-containing protein